MHMLLLKIIKMEKRAFSIIFNAFVLMLAALFASGGKADIVFVDPGTPGSGTQDFNVSADSALLIDMLFIGNQTLEWEAGTHLFATPDSPRSLVYVDGFFPNVVTLQDSVDETVVMTRAGTCPYYNSFPDPGVPRFCR